MQILYQVFFNAKKFPKDEISLPQVFSEFWDGVGESVDDNAKTFAEERARGVLQQQEKIDGRVQKHTRHWRLERLAPVDLSILRLAVYELDYSDIPLNIVINEAVDLAKKFGSEDSSSFINGILDAIAKDVGVAPSVTP
jgi:N utilization substance protein B